MQLLMGNPSLIYGQLGQGLGNIVQDYRTSGNCKSRNKFSPASHFIRCLFTAGGMPLYPYGHMTAVSGFRKGTADEPSTTAG